MQLLPHQIKALDATKGRTRVAYYLDMGLGKTFVGSEKATQLGKKILVVCQASMTDDWMNHFNKYYDLAVLDISKEKELKRFMTIHNHSVGVISYDSVWRRPQLKNLRDYTLMLDESSNIQNHDTKRSKFITLLGKKDINVILLSGTPCSGKYENLYTQCKLLGWDINKTEYDNKFIEYEYLVDKKGHFVFNPVSLTPIKVISGYKNEEELKLKLRELGAIFMKTDDVFELPNQTFTKCIVPNNKAYRDFVKNNIVTVNEVDLIGDTTFTRFLHQRMLCGCFNKDKLVKVNDLINSTSKRIIIFYNFKDELKELIKLCERNKREYSQVNGTTKDLEAYEKCENSITLCQYQSASRGLNLQLANVLIYFTPPVSVDFWMQSQKRIHRIGQEQPCYYYQLICKNSVEEKIYDSLERGVDYTNKLFEEDYK